MQNRCNKCQNFIDSQLISEPHLGLRVILNRPDVQIYQCEECSSSYVFTEQDISLVMLDESETAILESNLATEGRIDRLL